VRVDFERLGFHLAEGLFSEAEASRLRTHVTQLGERPEEFCAPDEYDPTSSDPLRRHPRLFQLHLRDRASRAFLLDDRLRRMFTVLLGREPVAAVQTMVYFKPPGSRGQALHQDQRYLRVSPGTCVAAWMALDPCDDENGCLQVVPGSHRLGVLCPIPSDSERSFTGETVPVPEGMQVSSIHMKPGDVLFFHGGLVHGSEPNTSARYRRIIVGHYATADAVRISRWYPDALSFSGEPVELTSAATGGPCGQYVDGRFRLTSTVEEALRAH
jgi:phytanoyl-CoA hydroxylase